jgi:hypothetical protein
MILLRVERRVGGIIRAIGAARSRLRLTFVASSRSHILEVIERVESKYMSTQFGYRDAGTWRETENLLQKRVDLTRNRENFFQEVPVFGVGQEARITGGR